MQTPEFCPETSTSLKRPGATDGVDRSPKNDLSTGRSNKLKPSYASCVQASSSQGQRSERWKDPRRWNLSPTNESNHRSLKKQVTKLVAAKAISHSFVYLSNLSLGCTAQSVIDYCKSNNVSPTGCSVYFFSEATWYCVCMSCNWFWMYWASTRGKLLAAGPGRSALMVGFVYPVCALTANHQCSGHSSSLTL